MAAVMRAAFMGAFTVLASAIARRGNSLNNLGLSVLLMMLINPHLPWDVGFQLSAMATLGLESQNAKRDLSDIGILHGKTCNNFTAYTFPDGAG